MPYTDEYVRQRMSELTDPAERSAFAWKVMDSGRKEIEDRLEREHPDWSRGEIVVGIVTELYGHEFTPEKLAHICESIRASHLRNP